MPPTTRPRLTREDVEPIPAQAERERWHFLGSYYSWLARHGGFPTPAGNDPITGRRWNGYDDRIRRLARAGHAAMAREAFAIARSYGPVPLP